MRDTFALRLISTVAFFCLMMLVFYPYLFPLTMVCLAVSAAAVSCAVRCRHAVFRLLLACLPLAGIVISDYITVVILFSVPALYLAIRLAPGRYESSYHGFKPMMFLMLYLSAVSMLFAFGEDFSLPVAIQAVTFWILGISVLREIRAGGGMSWRWRLYNTADVAAPMAAASALIVSFMSLVVAIVWCLQYPLAGFGIFLRWITEKIGKAVFDLVGNLRDEPLPVDEVEAQEFTEGYTSLVEDDQPFRFKVPDNTLQVILMIIIILGVIYILYRLIRYYIWVNTGVESDKGERVMMEGDLQYAGRRRRSRRRSVTPNEIQIRRIYQEYLRLREHKGMQLVYSTTSEDVLVQACAYTEQEGDVIMRNIYLKARYADPCEITASDVETVKMILQNMKKAE